jgi:hypothetical protein
MFTLPAGGCTALLHVARATNAARLHLHVQLTLASAAGDRHTAHCVRGLTERDQAHLRERAACVARRAFRLVASRPPSGPGGRRHPVSPERVRREEHGSAGNSEGELASRSAGHTRRTACGSLRPADRVMGSPQVARESSDQIHSIAEVLAATFTSSAVRHILAEHSPDSSGHCRGCRLPTTVAPVWPCRLWEIGKEMERLRAESGRR